MKTLAAAVLPMFALALAQSAFADDQTKQNAPSSAQTQTEQSGSTTANQGSSAAQAQGAATANGSNDQAGKDGQAQQHKRRTEHPPTAIMDRAAPTEKSKTGGDTSGKHPPARVMDRATPDVKSPAAASGTQGADTSSPNTTAK